MAQPFIPDEPWLRYQDRVEAPAVPRLARRYRPADLGELRSFVHDVEHAEGPHLELRGCGSHWAFSDAAVAGSPVSAAGVTPGAAIETNDPDVSGGQVLNRQLYNVIPRCLSGAAREFFDFQKHVKFTPAALPVDPTIFYLAHVESGMHIWELYRNLDAGEGKQTDSYAYTHPQYLGPWAMGTLGGAGGQTVGGAISTATHGGDVQMGPISNAVQALHLVGAGDKHFWIERPLPNGAHLVDDDLLHQVHPDITILRDPNPDILNAVVVAAGRMGVVYSYVLRVVRQFALHEVPSTSTWSAARAWINNPSNPVFTNNHFVQVIINPNPQPGNAREHSCFVLTRTLEPLDLAGTPPYGRAERGVDGTAGHSFALADPDAAGSTTLQNMMCTSDSPARAALASIIGDLQTQFDDAMSDVYDALLEFAVPFMAHLAQIHFDLAMAKATIAGAELLIVTQFVNSVPDGPLGQTMALLCTWGAVPSHKPYFRLIAEKILAGQQPKERTGISYAIMDVHNYLDISCEIRGDSLEVFFDASNYQLTAFIDKVLQRVAEFESGELTGTPMVFGGYIAVRFMTGSAALLAMQQSPHVASLEIAGLLDAPGTTDLLKRFEADAVDLGGRIHWGQRNDLDMKQVEQGYDPASPNGRLYRWRKVLSSLTDNGRLNVFSTQFSRDRGLEVVQPLVGSMTVSPTNVAAGDVVQVDWAAAANPPGTVASLEIRRNGSPNPVPDQSIALPGLQGSHAVAIAPGAWDLKLIVSYTLNGRTLTDHTTQSVTGYPDHSIWKIRTSAACLSVDGQSRWAYEVSFAGTVSPGLAVEEIYSNFTGNAGSPSAAGTWIARRAGEPDIPFTAVSQIMMIPNHPPLQGDWLFFLSTPGCGGAPPLFAADFRLIRQV